MGCGSSKVASQVLEEEQQEVKKNVSLSEANHLCRTCGFAIKETDIYVTFDPNSEMGIAIDKVAGVVNNVKEGGQGDRLGVKIGMYIVTIQGDEFSDHALNIRMAMKKPFEVKFMEIAPFCGKCGHSFAPGGVEGMKNCLRGAAEGGEEHACARRFSALIPKELKSGRLKITLAGARNLRAADWGIRGGSSDPYCSVEIAGKPWTICTTKHISKNLNPDWNEVHEVEDFEVGDSLTFKVYDYDRTGGDDLLAEVELAGHFFLLDDGGFSDEVPLIETGEKKKGDPASLIVKVEVIPGRPEALPVSRLGSRLKITMVGATDLRAADWSLVGSGKSDPFCVCTIIGKDDSIVETRPIDKTLEPVWNEEFIVDDYVRGDCLMFHVYDHDKGKSKGDSLGWTKLQYTDFDRDDCPYDGELRLKECGKGHTAMLKVKVEVLPPEFPDAPPVSLPVGSPLGHCALKVVIIGAHDLRAADFALIGAGKSDPLCVCQIPNREDSLCETKHIPKTLEPQWNEEHEIEYFEQGDPIEFKVFDYDGKMGSKDLLGKVTLAARDYDREGGYDGELRLKLGGKGKHPTLRVKVVVIPPDVADAPPISEQGSRLILRVHSAEGLRSADWSLMGKGKADPFCVCQIAGKEDSIVQTRHLDKTLSPVWDEEFEVLDWLRGDDVDLEVFDHDRVGAADSLGHAKLMHFKFDKEGGFDSTLKLKAAGKGNKKAWIRVKAVILPPLNPDAPAISVVGSSLQVHVLYAKGLRSADFSLTGKGSSDPFVTCQINGKQDSYIQTRHIDKSLDPIWEEKHEIDEFDAGDDLEFEVMDHDMASGADLLGRVTLPAREYDREGGFEGELRLRKCGKGNVAVLAVKVVVMPPEVPDERPHISEPGSRLQVLVHSATGLRAADMSLMGGKSDPYVICRILDRDDAEFQTCTRKSTLDPTWDEEFIFDEFDTGDNLEFQVMDHDKVGAHDLLGRRTVPTWKFDREGGFEGELKLKEAGKMVEGKIAILRVRLGILPPLTPNVPTVSEPGSRLRVRILSAAGLRAADFALTGGSSDPFCVCKLHGKDSTMFQTKVVPKSLEPVWDEEHIMMDYEHGDRMEFHVMDQDKSGGNDLLGRISLGCREFDREGGFSGTLVLKATGNKKGDSLLRVQVFTLCSIATEERLLAEARQRKREADERDMMSAAEQDQLFREEAARLQAIAEAEEEERLAQEARRKKAEEEAARKAALKARAEAERREITVPIHPVFSPDDAIAEVVITQGSTVDDLAAGAYNNARLPFKPRIKQGDMVLARNTKLIDAGVKNGQPLFAELAVVLTTSKDCTAIVWDALSGECLYHLQGHEGAVCSACAAPDLKWVVTCSEDLTAKLWVVQRDQNQVSCLFTLRGHTKAVNSVSFSSDGKWVVTGSSDCTAKMWSVRTGDCKRTFEGHRAGVFAASFTTDGSRLFTQARDGSRKTWEVETGRCTNTEAITDQAGPEAVNSVASNTSSAADGHIVASSAGGSSVKVREVGGFYQKCEKAGIAPEKVPGDCDRFLNLHTDDVVSVLFVDISVPIRINPALLAKTQRAEEEGLSPFSRSKSAKSLRGLEKSPTRSSVRNGVVRNC